VQRWRILEGARPVRRIELVVASQSPSGWSADTIVAAELCPP
jgi:hypothetical protein